MTVFLSIFAVIGIDNLSLYFVIRRRVLLDYCIFVFALMVYTSLFVLHIIGIEAETDGLSVIAASFAAHGGLLFSRSFFGIDQPSFPRVNVAYREMIDTIIRNLIANGIKFTGEKKSLHISSTSIDRKNVLKIRDEGMGMNPDLFNHFSEDDELRSQPCTDGERGFGFGLLICRDFIRLNDGTLVCESEIGKGTTFTMTLESAP